jgi:tetratricopeptide (TPR) repeat protein
VYLWRKAWGLLCLLTVWRTKVAANHAQDARDWRLAAELYERVLRRSRHLDGIKVQLGHMYKEMGEFELAAGQYYSVLERRPLDDDLHLQIGHLEKLRRRWSAATHHYGEAVRINPGNGDALGEYQSLGGGLADEGRAPRATAGASGSDDWPSPDDAALPPMPANVRGIYAMITERPAGF